MSDIADQSGWQALAAGLMEQDRFDAVAACILALALVDKARDSRTAARLLETGHALVLRSLVTLAEEPALIAIDRRDERTMRSFYHVTEQALALRNQFYK
ncbi:hypothetical protein FJU08_13785 [Martelella alba]|uniref:Uncharacterized protein n=1 Tax=Martelella alba TaxID=2590451 RepID=A0A506U7E3_9HYPH|nr:hypothetical protein [Martelella alba]TPW29408.1 hypothetical protein FJU08_13785 [Martelella alba]